MPSRKFRELVKAMPARSGSRGSPTVCARARPQCPLEEIREARQMTQAKLADALGVNQGEVSKIEHRNRHICTSARWPGT
mgnify:CR=1 FL=1